MIEGKAFCSDNEYRNHVCKAMRAYYQKEQERGKDLSYERTKTECYVNLRLIFENGFHETPDISDNEKMKVIEKIAHDKFSFCAPFQEAYELFKKDYQSTADDSKIKDLINEGYLLSDGKTICASSLSIFISKLLELYDPTLIKADYIYDRFQKKTDGSKYSIKNIENTLSSLRTL
ncbi:MAG: hypothetical protein PQJ59_12835 [Spirochaetales bacterium]|nr:hypothetical protein [Spirochaetales bacterium]